MKKAIKVEISGTDGAGKTTGLKYLISKIEDMNKTVLETREVGNPHIQSCVKLRELVLSPESNLSGEAMELIFSAMRFENDRLYKSVQDQYDFIVSDRGWFDHLAYTDHNVNDKFTNDLYDRFLKNYTELPDVVIYFTVDTETALKRRIKRAGAVDVIEVKGVEFQEKVRKSFDKYLNLSRVSNPKTVVIEVDANDTIEGVRSQVDQIVNFLTSSVEVNLTANG